MGKITGFMDYKRKDCKREDSLSRLKHWNEFDTPLKEEERKEQAARCMDCGVPFCSSGIQLNGMYINVKTILNNCANIFMYNCSIIFIRYFG